jgi:hypothetical protein
VTATGADEFVRQLIELRFEVERKDAFVTFPLIVPLGSKIGETIRLGLEAPPDFPLSPPPGPHIAPRLSHPSGAVHASPLGPDWCYWSRPFSGWAATTRTAAEYLSHVRNLLAQV